MNCLIFSGSLPLPLSYSTPEDTSTTSGLTSFTASLTFESFKPPASIMGIKGVAYATSLAAIFSLAILALFMKQKVAEVRLMSMRNFGIILIFVYIFYVLYIKCLKNRFAYLFQQPVFNLTMYLDIVKS